MRNNGRRDWRGIKDISLIQNGEVAGNHQDKSQQYIIGSESPISMPFLENLKLYNTRAYGAIAPEPLGCASHSYLLTEESVTDKRTNE